MASRNVDAFLFVFVVLFAITAKARRGHQYYYPQSGYQPHYPTKPLSNATHPYQTFPVQPQPQPHSQHNPQPHQPQQPSSQDAIRPMAKDSPLPPLSPDLQPGSLVAYIHSNGITGYMLITPDGSQTTVRYHLVGAPQTEKFRWMTYSLPLIPGSFSCISSTIGTMITDLTPTLGHLHIGRDIVLSSNLDLVGDNSIMGRSIVLEGVQSGLRTCATLLPATKKTFAEVKLHGPVAGSIKIIQTPVRTGVISEYLMYSNGERKDSVHQWALLEGKFPDSTPEAKVNHEKNKCAQFVGTPLFESNSAKSKSLTVSTEMPTIKGRSYQTVQAIQSIESLHAVYLVLYDEKDPQTVLACAPLNLIKPRGATARFGSNEVTGTITLLQESPYDPTQITSDLTLNANAFSYGIDVLPTIKRRAVETKKCPNVRETIYNPYNKDPEEVPPQGTGSSDQYAVGDLSGKFGTLDNPNHLKYKTVDINLPLFGYFSVIGRAVVIYSPDGPPIGCSNINLQDINLTTSYATFDVPFQGQFIFRQPEGNCFDDIYIYVEVSKPENTPGATKTFNHPWHVHEKQMTNGFESLSSTDCAAAGGHLNTFNASTVCIYQRDCTPFTSLRCEVGDETGKLSAIDIPVYKLLPTGEPDVGKYYFIDNNLSNCGPSSIIGRSIVIHAQDFGAPRVTCANILEFKPKSPSA